MSYIKYKCEFYSQHDESPSRWEMLIHKKSGTPPGSPIEFNCRASGFTLTMDGDEDTMLAPIKTSSAEFTFVIEDGNTDQEEIVEDLLAVANDNEGELCLELRRHDGTDFRRYWIGVILGDLSTLADRSPHNFIKIKAVDGLTQLKYKKFPDDKTGTRSALYYIKAALMEITSSSDNFPFWSTGDDDTRGFLCHMPFYYNKAMGNITSSSWRDDLDHDPLACVKIPSWVFKDKDGVYWSWYKILEQILSAFQLRIMMTPLRDDVGGSDWWYTSNCTWFLQAPLLNHSSSDNGGISLTSRYVFIHEKTLTTDEAVEYDGVSFLIANPETVIAGAKEKFIPPLLSYKSIYNHKEFLGMNIGPGSMQTAWQEAEMSAGASGVCEFSSLVNYAYMMDDNDSYDYYPLSKISEQPPVGWPGSYAQRTCGQKIVVTGNVTIHPKNHGFVASGGSIGYDSAGQYYNAAGPMTWQDAWGNNVYGIQDSSYSMPRLALRVQTIWKDPDGPIVDQEGDYYSSGTWWMGDRRFGILCGSAPYNYWDEPISGLWRASSNENWNYAQTGERGVYGYDGSWYGLIYNNNNPNNPNPTIYYDDDGVALWGTDIGYHDPYWWSSTSPDPWTQQAGDNRFAYFSPIFHHPFIQALNGNGTAGNWDSGWWDIVVSDYVASFPFYIESAPIPISRPLNDQNYGTNYIYGVQLIGIMGIDQCNTEPDSSDYWKVTAKSWDVGGQETSSSTNNGWLCRERGIQWDYELNDLRINITGVSAGIDSFDTTIAWYENTNGSPSEEMVQEPEIIIGDNPPEDPFAVSNTGNAGFGGTYPGQFRIYEAADEYGMAEEDSDTLKWRTRFDISSSSNEGLLHKVRAKTALAHYAMIKRGLELTFMDSTFNTEIQQKLASAVYYWNTGKWKDNAAGDPTGYVVTGFKFTAGTGEIKMTLEDCVTFQRSGLIDKTYSTNG
jgi:hypothetical protein